MDWPAFLNGVVVGWFASLLLRAGYRVLYAHMRYRWARELAARKQQRPPHLRAL